CYPEKSRSYLLSLGNVFFPFFNPAFAIGLGVIYWMITWQFQALVGQHEISSGKIDALGIATTVCGVMAYMPLYLIQSIISSIGSIGRTAVLGGLYATLLWYVDAVEWPGPRRYLTKFVVGTSHFLAHLTAMFTLSMVVVMLNNWMAPPIERGVKALYQSRGEQAPIIRDVVEESLQPLPRETQKREKAATTASEPAKPTPIREIVGFMSYPILMIIFGALVGGSLWGMYWVVSGL